MKMKNVFAVSLILLLLAACSSLKPTPAPTPTPQVLDTTGVQYHFVTNKLLLPTTKEQREEFALNVDRDVNGRLDNRFGDLLTLLSSTGPRFELQSTLDQAVNTGQLVMLHVVKANDPLNDPSVTWTLFQGQNTQSPPNFDGSDTFTIDSASLSNSLIIGSLTNGYFSGGPGTARVQMFLLGQLVEVDLIGVHLEADFSMQGCANGKLGGGLTVDEFRSKLLPTIADGLNQIIQTDSGAATTILKAFDTDHNGTITVQELEKNRLLKIAISPDLDLLDASGNFNPDQDGEKDSYSVGLGFTCVPANFIAPEED